VTFRPSTVSHRFGQDTLDRPTKSQATMNGCIVNTQSGGPLIDRQSFTVECQAMVHPAIVHLLKLSSPAAVARLVVAIIVDAIKGVLLAGPRPHVIVEVLERVSPAATDLNTPPAVVGIRFVPWRRASLNHSRPCLIFGCAGLTVRATGIVATTGDRSPANQRGCRLDRLVATLTATQPLGVVESVAPNVAKHRQAPEFAAGKIVFQTIGNGYNLVSHVVYESLSKHPPRS
jgi:hypothetical protein